MRRSSYRIWQSSTAQSTVEYALLIAVVAGALVAMQIYMKRGMQGKLRSATDDIGEQFSPDVYKAKFKTVQVNETTETLHATGQDAGQSSSVITSGKIKRESLQTEQLTDAQQQKDKLFVDVK